MFSLIFKNDGKEATHFFYFLDAYQRSLAILNEMFEGNSSSIISESRNYWVKGNQMWKVRETVARKVLNQSLDTQLWYTFFQIYIK